MFTLGFTSSCSGTGLASFSRGLQSCLYLPQWDLYCGHTAWKPLHLRGTHFSALASLVAAALGWACCNRLTKPPRARSHHQQVESSMLSATELGLLEIASKNRQPYIAHVFFLIEVQLNTTIYSVKFCHTAELFSNLYMYTFFFNILFHYGFYRILNVPNSKTWLWIHPVYSNYFCFTPASLSIAPHLAPLGDTSLFSVSASLSRS